MHIVGKLEEQSFELEFEKSAQASASKQEATIPIILHLMRPVSPHLACQIEKGFFSPFLNPQSSSSFHLIRGKERGDPSD